jgi:hypothetical protein
MKEKQKQTNDDEQAEKNDAPAEEQAYTDEEEELIRKRLEDLGYI